MMKIDKKNIIWVDEIHLRSENLNPVYAYFSNEKRDNIIAYPFQAN